MKLSNRLSIYVFVVCLVIGLGLTLVLERTVSRNQRQQAERVMTMLQRQLVANFKSEIGDVESQVRRSALVIQQQGFIADRADVGRLLAIMTESDSLIMGGGVAMNPDVPGGPRREWMLYVSIGPDGTLQEKLLGAPEYPYTEMQWFREPVEKGEACWSQAYMDRGAGETLMVTYAVPVFGDSTAAAVVTADISLSELARTVAALKPYKDSRSYLVDASGRIRAPGNGNDGHVAAAMGGSGDKIMTYTPVAGLPMRVMTVTPTASLMSVLKEARPHFIIIMLGGTIILIILVRTLLWRMTRPLDRLSEAADSIGRGDFETPLPDVGGYSDLNRLRTAMLNMEKSIADYVEQTAREALERGRMESERKRMKSELEVASEIQRAMLPADPPETLDIEGAQVALATHLQPALDVSGDLYYWKADGPKLVMVIADVSGKGVPASLLMVSLKERLSIDLVRGMAPAEILSDLNEAVCRNNPRNMFVTMQICVFDRQNMSLTIANAGHNPPVLRSGGSWNMLKLRPGLPIGIMDGMDYTETKFHVVPGDAFFMYTDGLTEAENGDGEQFGDDRLLRLLVDTDELPAAKRPEEISGRIMEFAPDDSHDDMTMVLARFGTDTLRLDLERSRESVAEAAEVAAGCAKRWDLGPKTAYNLNLVTEEWVTNIVAYTPRKATGGNRFTLTISCDGSDIRIVTSYAAAKFNPLAGAPRVNTKAPVDQRPVGGLGIFLIRSIASEVKHSYIEGNNIFEIKLSNIQS